MNDDDQRLTVSDSLALGTARARKNAGLSQAELAARCGMHRNAISNIERGTTAAGARSDPQLSTLLKLAAALNVSPASLVYGATLLDDSVETGPGEFVRGIDAYRWFVGYGSDMAVPIRALQVEQMIAEQSSTLRHAESIREGATGELVRTTAQQQAETARTLLVELGWQLQQILDSLNEVDQ